MTCSTAIIFLLFIYFNVIASKNVQIATKMGVLEGVKLFDMNLNEFNAFMSIPYAKPPIASLRFKPPVPAEPWIGVLNATNSPPVCVQKDTFLSKPFTTNGQEDCLYLNVYTPKLPGSIEKLLPVMVFIHGGGFICGSGNKDLYGPEFLMAKDVILVTFNYRLGVLGLLSTGDETVPGNMFLKDQNLALKWVQNNIKDFGGDPEAVTIFGQSAGGASVHLQVLSPLSKGLFKRAIAQSGSVFANWAFGKHTVNNSKKIAEMLDCPVDSSREMVDCLRKIDSYKLTDTLTYFTEWDVEPFAPLKAMIEIDHEGAFLSESPEKIIKNKKFNQVPMMMGVTSSDGAFRTAAIYSNPHLLKEFNEDFENSFSAQFEYQDQDIVPNFSSVLRKIRKFYFGDNPIYQSTKKQLIKLHTDVYFYYPVQKAIKLHAKFATIPIYYYLYDYEGPHSFAKLVGNDIDSYGACHSDELPYLFLTNLFFPGRNLNRDERLMIDKITTLWTNFAKTGNPTPTTNDKLLNVVWNPVSSDSLVYLNISNTMTMNKELFTKRAKFWEKLYANLKESSVKEEL